MHTKSHERVWHLVTKMKRKLMNGFQEGLIFNPSFVPSKEFLERKNLTAHCHHRKCSRTISPEINLPISSPKRWSKESKREE